MAYARSRPRNYAGLVPLLSVAGLVLTPGGHAPGTWSPAGPGRTAHAATSPPSPPTGAQRAMTTPDSFDGYVRMTGPDAQRVIQDIRTAQAHQNTVFAEKMRIAIYTKRGDPRQRVAFIGMAASDHPVIAQELQSTPPPVEVDSALRAMPLTAPKDYSPGPLGGVLRCAAGTRQGAGCAWADGSTVGVVAASASSAEELARTTLALRNAAEH